MKLDASTYAFVFSKCVRLCLDLCISGRKGVLLIKRSHAPYHGKLALPGGRMYFGETINAAATRIARDEIGARIGVIRLLGICEGVNEIKTDTRHTVSIVYACALRSPLRKRDSSHGVAAWHKNPPLRRVATYHQKIVRTASQ